MPTAATTANDKHNDWIRKERPFLTHGAHPSPPGATTHRFSRGGIILKVVDIFIGLRVSDDVEREGLDLALHGETVQ